MKRSSSAKRKGHFCSKCNKEFSTGTNLTRHMISHDGYKPYVCTICGNAFTQNGSLKSHMVIPTISNPKARIWRLSIWDWNYWILQFIHTGERPYVCTICSKGFTQSKSLTFHMRRRKSPYLHCVLHRIVHLHLSSRRYRWKTIWMRAMRHEIPPKGRTQAPWECKTHE